MAAFKFNLQQLDLTGAYDRYLKELEEQKKQEIYDNKLVEQEVNDFTKYYNIKNIRDIDANLLKASFGEYRDAANKFNKATRRGNVDDANANREKMQKATVDMGDIYRRSSSAKTVLADLAVMKKKEINGEIVIDDDEYNKKFTLFKTGNLDDITTNYGTEDTWGDVVNTVSLNNNKYNQGVVKQINAFQLPSVSIDKNQNFIKTGAPVSFEVRKLANGDEVKYPVYEYKPDYQKALVQASFNPDSYKRKTLIDMNAAIAKGGVDGDVAKQILQKVATAFGKTSTDLVTADELLAYKIAGETRKDIDEKEGMSIYELNIKNAQIKYKKELDEKKIQIAKARAANKGKGGSGKITGLEITAIKNYYDASKGDFTDNATGEIKPGKEAIFQAWLNGLTESDGTTNKVIQFFHKVAPKTKTDPKEMNRVLQGYMKNPQSLYGAMQ
jgi:hypothetical protein